MADQDIRSTSGDKASKPEETHESPSTSSVEATPVQQKQEEPTKGVLSRMKGLIPPWLTKNLTDPYKLKILFRCCIASWATFILIIPDRSLAALGNAAFFGCIASFIIPPMFAAQLFSMVSESGVGSRRVGLFLTLSGFVPPGHPHNRYRHHDWVGVGMRGHEGGSDSSQSAEVQGGTSEAAIE